MASRCYLFAIDTSETHRAAQRSMIGLGEYNYSIPLIYLILCSSDAKTCRSAVFKGNKKTSIVADFKGGVDKLRFFLEQISDTKLANPIRETLAWFNEPHNQFEHLLLEPGEIFDLDGGSHQNLLKELHQSINGLDHQSLKDQAKHYQDNHAMDSWSNFLYYEPKGCVKPPKDKKADRHSFTVEELEKYLGELEQFQCSHVSLYATKEEVDRAKVLLPELNRLPNLTEFWPKGEAVQDEVGQLTSITKLILTNNQLDALPEGLKALTQLEKLFLSANNFTQLPDVIKNLKNLKALNINKNQLAELPLWLGDLKHLRLLNVNQNKLRTLPASINSMTQLCEIMISVNALDHPQKELEKLGELPNIESIAMTGNQNAEQNNVPDIIWKKYTLKSLFLPKMTIQEIPADIARLSKLTRLGLSDCGISKVSENMWQLTDLEYLDLSNNPIVSLSASIANFTKLTGLNLSGCELNELPDVFQAHRQLENIQLRNNNLSEVPPSILESDGEPRRTVNLFENPVYDR